MELVAGTLVTVEEGAGLLRIKPTTVRKWLHEGRLIKVKIGRRTLLRRADLEALVARGVVAAPESTQ